ISSLSPVPGGMDRAPQPLASRTGSGDSSGPIISSSSLNAKNGTNAQNITRHWASNSYRPDAVIFDPSLGNAFKRRRSSGPEPSRRASAGLLLHYGRPESGHQQRPPQPDDAAEQALAPPPHAFLHPQGFRVVHQSARDDDGRGDRGLPVHDLNLD